MTQKKTSQNRSWMVTLKAENYTQEKLQKLLKSYTYVGQLEKGEKGGYEHWQLYIENKNPILFNTLKNKMPEAHLEPRRGTKKQAYDYVTKKKTAVPGSLIKNGNIDTEETKPAQLNIEEAVDMMKRGARADEVLLEYPSIWRAERFIDRIDAILQEERYGRSTRPVEVSYLYGEPGTGKSTYVNNRYGFENVYHVTSYEHPFDGYKGEPVLLLDEFYESIRFDALLNVLDTLPSRLPARYNDKIAAYNYVWIVSNRRLQNQYEVENFYDDIRMNAFYRRIRNNYEMVDFNLIKDNTFLDMKVPPEKRQ